MSRRAPRAGPAAPRRPLTAEEEDAAVRVPRVGGLDDLHLGGQPLPEAVEPGGPGGHQLSRRLQAPEPGACGGTRGGRGGVRWQGVFCLRARGGETVLALSPAAG